MIGTLVNLGLLYWKRHNHPWNLLLLSTFTVMEAFTLGVVVAFYDNIIVMQALSANPIAITPFCVSHK
jgi:FtsH-binding integral membrane protein